MTNNQTVSTDGPGGIHCAECHRVPRTDEKLIMATGLPWTWSLGSVVADSAIPATADVPCPDVLCPECTRDHSRSVEAKLDHDWW